MYSGNAEGRVEDVSISPVVTGTPGGPSPGPCRDRPRNVWILNVAYFLLPALTGALAIALSLTRRPWPPQTVWIFGSLGVAVLVAGISTALYRTLDGQVPAASLVKAFATLYYLPFLVSTGTAFLARARVRSRAPGLALVVVSFVVVYVAAARASEYFFGLVNARG